MTHRSSFALYDDERFCAHCDRDTPHTCRDGGHERDSSNDYQKCTVCGWYKFGFMREPSPPAHCDEER